MYLLNINLILNTWDAQNTEIMHQQFKVYFNALQWRNVSCFFLQLGRYEDYETLVMELFINLYLIIKVNKGFRSISEVFVFVPVVITFQPVFQSTWLVSL